MAIELRIETEPELVEDLYTALLEVEGVRVRLTKPDSSEAPFDPYEQHGAYRLGVEEWVPLFVSLTGVASSLLSLAAAFVALAKERRTRPDQDSVSEPIVLIQLNGQPITIKSTDLPQDVAASLESAVSRQPPPS
jgi:hypothetical protein